MARQSMRRSRLAFAVVASLISLGPSGTLRPRPPDLAGGFRKVPSEARLRMYWRVFGPAWTEPEIDRQLGLLKAAGLGGLTVYFLYPVALDDPARGIMNQRFGSVEFLRTFAYAARRARSLGLRFSVNGGTGWPFGGPTVAPSDSAQRLREIRASAGGDSLEALRLGENEQIAAAFLGGRDATRKAREDHLPNPLPAELRVYVSGPTGMQVKRAAFGGEGAVLNHYDGRSLERWLEANLRPLLDAAPGLVEGVGCDSLEVYHANWTSGLPVEFKKRRGYDLLPRLPELFDDQAAETPGLRFDFWRTLAELAEERFTRALGEWCRRRGVGLEMEIYGTPPQPMTAARHVNLPTGEHYEWKGFAVQRYVASMARVCGRRVVGSEAWTWLGLPNRLADSLGDLKLASDLAFLCGANDLTGVDFPYSPEAAGSPGWLPYYGPFMGPGNPQWRFFPALVSYLNRCQWMLRQGEPVRKVAVYLPVEDAFSSGPVDQMLLDFALRDRLATGHLTSEFGLQNALRHRSDLIHGLMGAGYDFDGLDFWTVARWGRPQGGQLVVGEATYEAVILPNLERVDLAAFKRLASFVRAGGTVVATRRLPDRVPGFGRERDSKELRRLVAEVFGENPVYGKAHPSGRGWGIFVREDLGAAAALKDNIRPSVRLTPRLERVGFVHRRVDERDIFFFANVGADSVRFIAKFPGSARRIEFWDGLSGGIRLAATESEQVEISLPPRGSVFVVRGGATPAAEFEARPEAAAAPRERRRLDLEWSLSFAGPDPPVPVRLRQLRSWTEIPGGRYFSGTGIYRGNFTWSEALPAKAAVWFERVYEAAEVRLNGRSLGVIFTPPLAVDLGPALRPGDNEIEVIVVNLPLNRFLGLPDEDLGPLRARFGTRFPAPEEKRLVAAPAPAGLMDDVWLEISRRP